MNTFTFIFLIALIISYSIQFWLSKRQATYVQNHRASVPTAFRNSVSLQAHQKAADYTIEKGRLGDIDSFIESYLRMAVSKNNKTGG